MTTSDHHRPFRQTADTVLRVELDSALPRVRFAPVDTMVILQNLARHVRQSPKPTGIDTLTLPGLLRLYVAPNVAVEVDEKLEGYFEREGLDPRRGEIAWRALARRIRVVDPGNVYSDDSRVSAVCVRDPDDAPTAALAVLLGVQALSKDGALVDAGLAAGDTWLEFVFAAGYAVKGEAIDIGVAAGVTVSAATIKGTYNAVRSLASSRNGQLVLTGIGLTLVLLAIGGMILCAIHEPAREKLRAAAKDGAHALITGGKWTLGGYAHVTVDKLNGYTRLRAGAVSSATAQDHVALAARILAGASQPITTGQLVRRIWGYQRVPRKRLEFLQSELQRQPAFVEVTPGSWQLGRSLEATHVRNTWAAS